MKLTKVKALDMSIELWEAVVEKGVTTFYKKVELCREMFGEVHLGCPLCEHSRQLGKLMTGTATTKCPECPYCVEFGYCENDVYGRWHNEHDQGCAQKLLDQLYLIRGKGLVETREDKLKEEIPEPKFKVEDRVRVLGGSEGVKKEFTIELMHWGDGELPFKGHNHWHYGWKASGYYHPDGYFEDEKNLELVPKEEWVDVTKECTLTMSGNEGRISVRHGGIERLLLGSKGAKLWCCQGGYLRDDNYKVELGNGSYSCGSFKVLKKVIK